MPAFRVELATNDLICVGVPLNPTHSLSLSCYDAVSVVNLSSVTSYVHFINCI